MEFDVLVLGNDLNGHFGFQVSSYKLHEGKTVHEFLNEILVKSQPKIRGMVLLENSSSDHLNSKSQGR